MRHKYISSTQLAFRNYARATLPPEQNIKNAMYTFQQRAKLIFHNYYSYFNNHIKSRNVFA